MPALRVKSGTTEGALQAAAFSLLIKLMVRAELVAFAQEKRSTQEVACS
jgi:hypothetical protein